MKKEKVKTKETDKFKTNHKIQQPKEMQNLTLGVLKENIK